MFPTSDRAETLRIGFSDPENPPDRVSKKSDNFEIFDPNWSTIGLKNKNFESGVFLNVIGVIEGAESIGRSQISATVHNLGDSGSKPMFLMSDFIETYTVEFLAPENPPDKFSSSYVKKRHSIGNCVLRSKFLQSRQF